jgi:mannose-6-phosphate isomerase-like protein (cupin superfamily)
MAFGLNFEDVSKVKHPDPIQTSFGQKVDALTESEFILKQFFIEKGKTFDLDLKDGAIFIERGKLISKTGALFEKDNVIKPIEANGLRAEEESLIYFFSGPSQSTEQVITRTFDVREKYWGKIESIISGNNYAGKKIFMNVGTQSSLEYHLYKKEGYILQSGKLKVGLRVGRAENRSVILYPGDTYVINPGTMHMRIALEPSIIIEISTADDDKDSNLVEDGKTYVHKEVNSGNWGIF